jgi:two-component system, NarL family, sensor kinase
MSAVTSFGLAGLGAVLLLIALIIVVLSRISVTEARLGANERARLAGYGIVEPTLANEILDAGPTTVAALAELESVVTTRVLSERVIRVKIWTPDGKIVYSDESELIGQQFAPKPDHVKVLASGRISSEIAHVDGAENRFERA